MPMPTYGGQAFVPQPATSKAIPIINPNTSEVINLSTQTSSSNKDASAAPATAAAASAAATAAKVDDKETKDFKIAATPSRAIKIVNPRVSNIKFLDVFFSLLMKAIIGKGGRSREKGKGRS
jgi:hypothetical protein